MNVMLRTLFREDQAMNCQQQLILRKPLQKVSTVG